MRWQALLDEWGEWPILLSMAMPNLGKWGHRILRINQSAWFKGLDSLIAPHSVVVLDELKVAPPSHTENHRHNWDWPIFALGMKARHSADTLRRMELILCCFRILRLPARRGWFSAGDRWRFLARWLLLPLLSSASRPTAFFCDSVIVAVLGREVVHSLALRLKKNQLLRAGSPLLWPKLNIPVTAPALPSYSHSHMKPDPPKPVSRR